MASMKAVSCLVACLMATSFYPLGCDASPYFPAPDYIVKIRVDSSSSSSDASSDPDSSSSFSDSASSSSFSDPASSSSSAASSDPASSSSSSDPAPSSSSAASSDPASSSSAASTPASSSDPASSSASSDPAATTSSTSPSSSAAAAFSSSSSSSSLPPDTEPAVQVPVVPSVPAFNLPAELTGGDTITIDMGSTSSTASAKLVLVLSTGEELPLFGPEPYPTTPIQVTLPVLITEQTGAFLKIETISAEGAILNEGCAACISPTFTLKVGGKAADPAAVVAAQQPIAATEAGSVPADDVIFVFRVREANNAPLSSDEVSNAIESIDTSNIDSATALNVLLTLGGVLSASPSGDAAEPSPAAAAKIEAMMAAVLAANDGVEVVFEKDQSDSLMDTLTKFLAAFGLSTNSKKFFAQLTAAEEAANVIPKLLESIRQVAAKTLAAAGNINRDNICSHVVTNIAGGTFCNANGGAFPHVVELIGNNLPADSTRRMTAVAMTLAQMDRSDQTLTNTLDLTSAISPTFARITTPLVSDPAAHQLRSTFDSAKGNNFAAAADNTFNCYQRITTNNGDPSGTYNQIAAADQDRPSATTVRCIGANSGPFRWVTLAKSTVNNNNNNNNNNNPTVGSSTITSPVTPTAPTAAAVAADSDDGSSASGIIGGLLGGVGFLLIIFALIAFILLNAKKTSHDTQALTTEEVYWQNNGTYKAPAPTPV